MTIIKEKLKTWQKKEENAVQDVTGAFVPLITLTTRRLAAGKYRVQWNVEARLQAGSTSLPKVQLNLDASARGVNVFPADDEWRVASGWDFFTFAEGDKPVIDIQGRTVGGADTAEFRRCKLSIELMEE
jgi:hypothetical protein